MKDYIAIGPVPPDEPCTGVGHPDYHTMGIAECRIYKRQLQREFPDGIFRVKSFPHDFGTYHEVVAIIDDRWDEDDPRIKAAYDAEGGGNLKWDPEARTDLAELKRI